MAKDGIPKNKKDNSRRKFKGGGPRPDRREYKRQAAAEANEIWRQLSPREQLDQLDLRLGKNVGACKQRERLHALIVSKSAADVNSQSKPKEREPKPKRR